MSFQPCPPFFCGTLKMMIFIGLKCLNVSCFFFFCFFNYVKSQWGSLISEPNDFLWIDKISSSKYLFLVFHTRKYVIYVWNDVQSNMKRSQNFSICSSKVKNKCSSSNINRMFVKKFPTVAQNFIYTSFMELFFWNILVVWSCNFFLFF